MGLFITLEGTDGSGKTTQIEMLKEHFKKTNEKVLFTREPGGTVIAEKLRDMVISKENDIEDVTEALLYAAARCEHVNKVIKPFVSDGGIVICDRFLDSSLAYQGFARGLGFENIMAVNNFALNGFMPDITFFLDLSPKDGLIRKSNQKVLDRIESLGNSFHEKVYAGYKKLEEIYPNRIISLDATLQTDELHSKIINEIEDKKLTVQL